MHDVIADLARKRASLVEQIEAIDAAVTALEKVDFSEQGEVSLSVKPKSRKKPKADKPKAKKTRKRAPRVSQEEVQRRVTEALKDGDKTRRELEAETGVNYAAVGKAIEALGLETVGDNKRNAVYTLNGSDSSGDDDVASGYEDTGETEDEVSTSVADPDEEGDEEYIDPSLAFSDEDEEEEVSATISFD